MNVGKKKTGRDWLDWLNKPQEGGREILDADLHRYYWKNWKYALHAYLANPLDFYAAEYFLQLHPANQRLRWGSPDAWFHENLWWWVTRADPTTGQIEKDSKRNVKTVVYVEWGPYIENSYDPNIGPQGIGSHDHRVDTKGKTFEEAIVHLAHNVWMLYGARPSIGADARLKKKDRW